MTTNNGRLAALDGWRGLAILAVLFGHFVTIRWLNAGRLGVELFFALSGSLIGSILFARHMPIAEFAVRRFSRILPSMWIFCLVAIPVGILRHDKGAHLVAFSLMGLGNYFPETMGRIEHLWSIGVELQSYTALAAIAIISRRFKIAPHIIIFPLIGLAWLVALSLHLQGADDYQTTYWRFEFRSTAILGSAALISLGADRLRKLPNWPIFLALGCLLQTQFVPDVAKYTIGSAFIAAACVRLWEAKDPPRWLISRPLRFFGSVSFSIYLYQQLFFVEQGLRKPVALLLAIGAGTLAHYAFDSRVHKKVCGVLLGRIPRTLDPSAVRALP